MILSWFGPDGVLYFFFNQTYFPLLGPRLAWAMGERFDKVWADAWMQAKPIIDQALAGETQRFVDLPWKLDTDRGVADTFWTFSYSRVLDETGEAAGVFIFTNETTDRVVADAGLLQAQQQLEALNATLERQVADRTADRNRLWQLSSDIMLVADFDGTIEAVNPAWTQVLGWAEAELVGRSLFDFIHPDDLDRTIAGAKSISTGHALARFENQYRCKDGSFRDILWAGVPGDGKIIAVGRDFTVDKARARALAEAEDQLRQSQKMEAIGQLTGGIAHDFNNLLAGISGALELLGTRVAQGRIDAIPRYLDVAQSAARRAAALTQRLLAFSRRQTLDPKPTDVNRLVTNMEELIRRSIGPDVWMEVVGAVGLWTTLVDPSQLENALLNLCINARDAMPDGGRLTIETANKWLDDQAAKERELPPGQYVSLCVTDTGAGMSSDVAARVFDPFFTTKPLGQGTGLGLSMIYGFVRQSGGQVRIYTETGEGTTMCLYFPRFVGEAAADEAPIVYHAFDAGQGETVLVIDDEPTVRMLIVDVLQEAGYRVLEADEGSLGLKVLQSPERIDLLITDVGLPGGMNGRQVADAGRVLRPDLKVLFITGYAENAAVGHGHLDPDMQVITKPFPIELLGNKVREMIDG